MCHAYFREVFLGKYDSAEDFQRCLDLVVREESTEVLWKTYLFSPETTDTTSNDNVTFPTQWLDPVEEQDSHLRQFTVYRFLCSRVTAERCMAANQCGALVQWVFEGCRDERCGQGEGEDLSVISSYNIPRQATTRTLFSFAASSANAMAAGGHTVKW